MTTKEPATGRRAIGYVRVSTAGQEDHGTSLATQRERVREYATAKELELVAIVAEAASGGVLAGEESSLEHRPQLESLIARAARREYDVLVVATFDRLSRDHTSLVLIERRLANLGVKVHSTAEENGDGRIAEFIRGQLALVAQLERATILDRVRAGKAARKLEGRHVHGSVPYGYRSVSVPGGGRTLEPVDATAAVVRRIFADAKEGDTPGRITEALNRDGVAGPRGGAWNRTAVRGIIENVAYAGERYAVKRAHPAVVTRQLWNAANAELERRGRG